MLGVAFFYAKNKGGCIFKEQNLEGVAFWKREEDFSNINNDLSIYNSIESTSISPDISLGKSESLKFASFKFSDSLFPISINKGVTSSLKLFISFIFNSLQGSAPIWYGYICGWADPVCEP